MCVCRSIFLGSTRALYKERNDDDSLGGKCRERKMNGKAVGVGRSFRQYAHRQLPHKRIQLAFGMKKAFLYSSFFRLFIPSAAISGLPLSQP